MNAPTRTTSDSSEDGFEQPPPLEQRDVEERRVVEPQQVGGDVADLVVLVERLRGERLFLEGHRVDRAVATQPDQLPERRHLIGPDGDRRGMCRLLGQEAIEHDGAGLHRRAEGLDDRRHPEDLVALAIDQGRPVAIDGGQGPDPGPQRFDERVEDLLGRAVPVGLRAERLEELPRIGGRGASAGSCFLRHCQILPARAPLSSARDERRPGRSRVHLGAPPRARRTDPQRTGDRPGLLGAVRLRQHDLLVRGRVRARSGCT